MAAQRFLIRSEEHARELMIDDGHFGCVFAVVPGKSSSRADRCFGGREISRRNAILHGFRCGVGGPVIRCAVGKHSGVGPADIQRNPVRVARRCDARNFGNCIEHAPLHGGNLFGGVPAHFEIRVDLHRILRNEAEVAVQRTHHAAYCDERRRDENGTDGDLQCQQHITERDTPRSCKPGGACFDALIGIGLEHLAERDNSEKKTAD